MDLQLPNADALIGRANGFIVHDFNIYIETKINIVSSNLKIYLLAPALGVYTV